MKKYICVCLIVCVALVCFGCKADNISEVQGESDEKMNSTFYSNAEKIEIHIGETKFTFEDEKEIEKICELFEDIVGNKAEPNKTQAEGFYEIVFFTSNKEEHVILTGTTIFVNGVEYYTNKNTVEKLSKFLT